MKFEALLDRLLGRSGSDPSDSSRDDPPSGAEHTWLPIIDTDSCSGCGRCAEACDVQGLTMVWSFATLAHPEVCTGDALCVDACPEDLIGMDWVPWCQS